LGAADPAEPVSSLVESPYRWTWAFLLAASLLVFPGYVIYSRIMGQALGARGRRWFPVLLTVSSFFVIQAFLLCVYPCLGKLAGAGLKDYFVLTPATLLRNGWWTAVNMALSIAVFYVRKADDEKDAL